MCKLIIENYIVNVWELGWPDDVLWTQWWNFGFHSRKKYVGSSPTTNSWNKLLCRFQELCHRSWR
jgi:hypothetical protein